MPIRKNVNQIDGGIEMRKNVKFTMISQNEYKFEFKGLKFILEEGKIGTYGGCRCIRLHQLNGVKKEFVKCVGWISPDRYHSRKECITSKDISMEEAKPLAVDYLENLLS
jgi:hypothetical protein